MNMINFNNAYGALLGAFVGDAAGATLEFVGDDITTEMAVKAMHMPGGGVLKVGPGQITDDSELALALAHALCDGNPSSGLPLDKIARNYCDWLHSNPFDVGNTCRRAFHVADKNGKFKGMEKVPLHCYMMQNAAIMNEPMESNGSLMRIVPLAIWSAGQTNRVIAHNARMDAMLSHPNRVCQDCNALYCIAIAYLIQNPGDARGALETVEEFMQLNYVHPTVVEWYEECKKDISDLDCTYCMGHVKYGFILAFHFLHNQASFEEAIRMTLEKGGDTDTNAAIVGGMMGALHGVAGIPSYMTSPVESFDCTVKHPMGYVRSVRYSTKMTKEIVENLLQVNNSD